MTKTSVKWAVAIALLFLAVVSKGAVTSPPGSGGGGGTTPGTATNLVASTNASAVGAITNLLWGKTLWLDSVYGNDRTAIRGDASKPYLTPRAAWTNALSSEGDLIYLRPGDYTNTVIESTLSKSNVNWYLEAGARLWQSNTVTTFGIGTARSLFDDIDGAVHFSVYGYGDLIYDAGVPPFDAGAPDPSNTSIKGGIYLQNSNSSVNIHCHGVYIRSYHSPPVEASAAYIKNCTNFVLTCDEVVDIGLGIAVTLGLDEFDDPYTVGATGSGLYWELGETYYTVGVTKVGHYPIYASQPLGSTHRANLWARCGYLTNTTGGSAIYLSGGGSSLSWKTWIDVLAVETAGAAAYTGSANGSHYLRANKLMGGIGLSMIDNGSGTNKTWVDVQKVTSTSIACLYLEGANAGTFYDFTIHELDPAGSSTEGIRTTGGSGIIRSGRMRANLPGMIHNGGTYTLDNYVLNTRGTGSQPPLTVNTSGLKLNDVQLICTNTIAAVWTSQATNNDVIMTRVAMTTEYTNKCVPLVGPITLDANLTK